MRRSVHATSLLVIVGLVVVSFSGVQNASSLNETEFEVSGPYIDEEMGILIFILTSLEVDTYRFTYNPEFHYTPTRLPTEPVYSTTISSSITTNGADWFSIFNVSLISGSGVVIIFCSVYILNQRREKDG